MIIINNDCVVDMGDKMTTMWMVRGRMSAPRGQVEMVEAPQHSARTYASGAPDEVIARFGARRAGRPTVAEGFTFIPFESDQSPTVEVVARPNGAGVVQIL